jgi:5,10-methylene-tetrahydrofolate dehydrogenase/methenyl tetrahydrofolate cyclohydrolase
MKPPYFISIGCALAGILLLRLSLHYSLRNKIVVITGGSRGLGLAMAREFARHGAQLALLSRGVEELQRTLFGCAAQPVELASTFVFLASGQAAT